ncbi:MAG: DUF924 domain-containing protein [Deltaproteobacteria bacterium]|nr:DUF924 domain-containing protein [Deltaproteobacteria bacterium]
MSGSAPHGLDERAAALLRFWFGDDLEAPSVTPDIVRRWFAGGAAMDAECARHFGDDLAAAARGELDGWVATPRGRLALVLLLDQLSRNVWRATPAAFAQDAAARRLAAEAVERGEDRVLTAPQRVFLYLPFEHGESLADQRQSVALFEALARDVPEPDRALFEHFADYARRHAVVIERFGRFPHRNAVLGRESTTEELAFLAEPGSSF